MNLWKKAAVLLTAALALGIGTVEASESPELEPIAAHAEIWRDEYFNFIPLVIVVTIIYLCNILW